MKKVLLGVAVLIVAAAAGVIVMKFVSAQNVASASTQVSEKSARTLQKKIDDIKQAEDVPSSQKQRTDVEVSEAELESYVLYSLRDMIPAQLDSFHVQLNPGTVAAETQITFNSNTTGNPMVDAVFGGTHNLFLKGALVGEN